MADNNPRFSDDAGLAARLRALPQHEPVPGLWNEIALSLTMPATSATPRRRWHLVAASALAASLLVAALLPWPMNESSEPATVQPSVAATQDSADLGWLRTRSAQLEGWLGKLPPAPVANGRDLMAKGIIPAANMLPEVAYIKLGWALGQTNDPEEVKKLMLTPINDEITPREPYNGYLIYQGGVKEVEDFIRKVHK